MGILFRNHSTKSLWLAVVFLTVMFAGYMAGFSSDDDDDEDQRRFPQPEVRTSKHGVLRTTLEASIATNWIRDPVSGERQTVKTPTYEERLTGPTLRVKPGDTIEIDLINEFPPNPEPQRMGAFPHDPFTTNIHTHGLTVSPSGISDNVFRRMEPGTSNAVRIELPADHAAGTFWYHPHKHGSASFQFFGGMAGFLIIEGGPASLDGVPEVAAAREVLMAFQVIRTDAGGEVPYVNPDATQFDSGGVDPPAGLWSTFQNTNVFFTTNGRTNPTLRMRPGEVQRWRLLNAASGVTLAVALEQHSLNLIAMDGLTTATMRPLPEGEAFVMGAGNRVDVLVQAGAPGTYLLQALDPATPRSISPSGVDPQPRTSRIGFDFPTPTYPVTLATVVVSGDATAMALPAGPLPAPSGLPSIETMLNTPPDAVRTIAFEACGKGGIQANPQDRLPSCGWYDALYDAAYWGGIDFANLLMMRDADDTGVPSNPPDPLMPLVDFQKEGLFNADVALFPDMVAGNFEEWTVWNRSFSDHPFHIHVNPFLVTHINGTPLPVPEWRDTILIPAAEPQPGATSVPINDPSVTFGSVTFRTQFDPKVTGSFVMHCHILTHEDVGMMQRLDIVP